MERRSLMDRWRTSAFNLVAVLVVFFAVPVDEGGSARDVVLPVLLTVGALGAIAAVVVREVRRARDGDQPGLSGLHLALLAEGVLVIFALVYYVLASSSPGQLEGLETRLDALYFSATTMTTVGYGDIHASGQVARALVTLQLAFDVVFVAALASLFRRRIVRPSA